MLHIAICDDAEYDREEIEKVLTIYLKKQEIEHDIDMFPLGKSFWQQGVKIEKYDIIFLDINMKEMDGLETAKRLKKTNPNVYLVLVTAFRHYSIEGYKVGAVRYILKNDLKGSIKECMEHILENMKIHTVKIRFPFREGEREILVHNILFIESIAHMLNFHMFKPKIGEYSLYEKLDNMELQLQNYDFIRIHKSYLVNMNYVEEVNSYKAMLMNGVYLPIPKARYPFVKNKILLFKGERI